MLETALAYHAAGLCVLPAIAGEKRPVIASWKTYQRRRPTNSEIRAWFSNQHDALCLICGAVAGHQEMIDFDHRAELYETWRARISEQVPALLDKLFIERSPAGGRHVSYRCDSTVCGNLKLAQRRIVCVDKSPVVIDGKTYKPRKEKDGTFAIVITLIETRGEGGLFLCAPSAGYEQIQGDLGALPVLTAAEREILLEAAYSLSEHVGEIIVGTGTTAPASLAGGSVRPGDDFNARGDIRPTLQKHGWTLFRSGENEHWCRPGKERATSATLKDGVFYVFTSSVPPLDAGKGYSPFATYALLEHSGDFSQAAAALCSEGYGSSLSIQDVNLSGILNQNADAKLTPGPADPGPIPESFLRVPGFISEVMDFCLETAPYPNLVLAFCGALCLQAFLAGRKVRDSSDNRTNLYMLGLAHSAVGKDWPRKVNMRIAHRIGIARAVAERFASGEGLQDALFTEPCMLFQTDEIDGMLRLVNGAQDSRHENIITQLLMMYSSANSVLPMRKLAKQDPGVIDQPCLVLFGTAIPNHYYDALSERMLTNGLFARMLVLESGPRSKGQDAKLCDPPPRVLCTAKWWNDFMPGNGNLRDWHPIPLVIDATEEAKRLLTEVREHAEAEYAAAESAGDPIGTTVWGRVDEQVRKLSLIYAISADHLSPSIRQPAVQWARDLILHQTRRMLFCAQDHMAESLFDADCKRLVRKIRAMPGKRMQHSKALKAAHMDLAAFTKLIQTLIQREEIEVVRSPTSGRELTEYRAL